MHSPLALEAFAHDVIRARLDEAAHDALVNSLPRSQSSARRAAAARQYVASSLRALACRLDPCVVAEPGLLVATQR